MFARTPIGKILAFSGAQLGHPVYLSSVDVAELQKWTFSDLPHDARKISRRALAPGPQPDASAFRLITSCPLSPDTVLLGQMFRKLVSNSRCIRKLDHSALHREASLLKFSS